MELREVKKLIFDVQEAAGLIESFVLGKSFQDYQSDKMLQSAVERQFEIIGEAMRQAIGLDSSIESRVTACRRIIDFRNRLAHGYSDVSAAVVWGIVERNLPLLITEVRGPLQEE